MTVMDRHDKRQVATGFMEHVQLYVYSDDSTTPPTFTTEGWEEVDSSTLSPDTVIIRDPWQYKFIFNKEVKPAAYAN